MIYHAIPETAHSVRVNVDSEFHRLSLPEAVALAEELLHAVIGSASKDLDNPRTPARCEDIRRIATEITQAAFRLQDDHRPFG